MVWFRPASRADQAPRNNRLGAAQGSRFGFWLCLLLVQPASALSSFGCSAHLSCLRDHQNVLACMRHVPLGAFLIGKRAPAALLAINLRQPHIFHFKKVLFSTSFYFQRFINLYIKVWRTNFFIQSFKQKLLLKKFYKQLLFIIYTYNFLWDNFSSQIMRMLSHPQPENWRQRWTTTFMHNLYLRFLMR